MGKKLDLKKKYNVKNASFEGASALKSGMNSCNYAKDYKFVESDFTKNNNNMQLI